jgi:predicted transcriptional regulator
MKKKAEFADISKMEQLAIEYSERLINNRIEIYFPNDNWESFFSFNVKKLYKILFDISLNTPRKIGYILSYCFDSCLIHNTPISVAALENAAHRYYADVIEKYFLVNEHICKPFEDKISNEHQYDLLLKIVERQNKNKNISKTQRNNETSHFYINSNLSHLLDNLELNNFISTYNKVKDENNVFSTIYSLDFGLCQNFQLKYAKSGLKKIEKRFTKPLFNFNSLIIDFFNSTQIIRCKRNHEFPYSEITEFKKFKMNCPICLEENILTKCEVEMKFKDLKKHFIETEEKEKIIVRFQEFLILELLKLSQKPLSISKISMTLDISLVSTQSNLKKLVDKGMCEHDLEISKQLKGEYVLITLKGVKIVEKINSLVYEMKELQYNKPNA